MTAAKIDCAGDTLAVSCFRWREQALFMLLRRCGETSAVSRHSCVSCPSDAVTNSRWNTLRVRPMQTVDLCCSFAAAISLSRSRVQCIVNRTEQPGVVGLALLRSTRRHTSAGLQRRTLLRRTSWRALFIIVRTRAAARAICGWLTTGTVWREQGDSFEF